MNISGCEDGCENTIGSFFCTCLTFGSGFRANGTRCVGMYGRSLTSNVRVIMGLCINEFQILMNVLKEFITVPVKIIENATIQTEDLNVFVMMVMKRIAVEHVWVRKSIPVFQECTLNYILPTSDIDECLVGTALCMQNCNNTLGSYECSCRDGFNEDRFNCIGMLIIILNFIPEIRNIFKL